MKHESPSQFELVHVAPKRIAAHCTRQISAGAVQSPVNGSLSVLLILVMAVPTLIVSPPLIDLLGHIGRFSVQTGIDTHPWLRQYFTFHWRVIGNLGADILVQLLAPVFDVETSVRIIVIFNQLLAGAAILVLSREVHGRITAFSLFGLPLIYSLPFTFGFINFTLSMALALLAFSLWLRLGRTDQFRPRRWLFVPISVAVWLCHTVGWAFLCLLCAGDAFVRLWSLARDRRSAIVDTVSRYLPLAAPVPLMLIWRSDAAGDTEGWFLFQSKFDWILSILQLDNMVIDVASTMLLLGLIYFGFRSPRIARSSVLAAGAALSAVAFVFLPLRMFGSYFADMRLAPYVVLLALLALDDAPLDRRKRRALFAGGIAFLIMRDGFTTATYLDRKRDLDTHLQALAAIPEGARVATLVFPPCSSWGLPWLTHVGGMAIARRYAFANDQWPTAGVNLMTVHYPQAGEFQHDTSEIANGCALSEESLRRAVARVPARAFTHLWIVGIPPRNAPIGWFKPVWRGSDSAVYRSEIGILGASVQEPSRGGRMMMKPGNSPHSLAAF